MECALVGVVDDDAGVLCVKLLWSTPRTMQMLRIRTLAGQNVTKKAN